MTYTDFNDKFYKFTRGFRGDVIFVDRDENKEKALSLDNFYIKSCQLGSSSESDTPTVEVQLTISSTMFSGAKMHSVSEDRLGLFDNTITLTSNVKDDIFPATNLKDCPLCGSRATATKGKDGRIHGVSCTNSECGCTIGWFASPRTATLVWNERA